MIGSQFWQSVNGLFSQQITKVILDVDFHVVFPFVKNAKLQAANQHIG